MSIFQIPCRLNETSEYLLFFSDFSSYPTPFFVCHNRKTAIHYVLTSLNVFELYTWNKMGKRKEKRKKKKQYNKLSWHCFFFRYCCAVIPCSLLLQSIVGQIFKMNNFSSNKDATPSSDFSEIMHPLDWQRALRVNTNFILRCHWNTEIKVLTSIHHWYILAFYILT